MILACRLCSSPISRSASAAALEVASRVEEASTPNGSSPLRALPSDGGEKITAAVASCWG